MGTARAAPTLWTIDLPGWRPAWLNELLGHPLKAHRLKARDRRAVAQAAALAGVPLVAVPLAERKQRRALGLPASLPGDPAPRRRRVRVTITTPRSRPDDDSPLKSLLDALVGAGLLVDDSARWCAWEVPTFARGPLGTVVTLEDPGDRADGTPTAGGSC